MQIFLKTLTILLLALYFWHSSADFRIIEVFPNTTDDSELEYIKIQNISSWALNLSGFIIEDLKKQYIFWDEILNFDESYVLERPQSKIVLNNSNETIRLLTWSWEVIDEISYKKSIKGEILYFDEENILSEESSEWWEETSNDELLTGSWVIVPKPVVETLFSWALWEKIEFQRPSYVTQSWSSDTYICDNSKDACKINFNFDSIFHDTFKSSEHRCETNFWFTWALSQQHKCNPNTLEFPLWETSIEIYIYDKTTWDIIDTKSITIISNPSIKPDEEYKNPITILMPRVTVQSGLDGQGRYLYCKKQICKINLEYKKRHKDERCIWRFRDWVPSSKTTFERCNPGYVEYPKWIHYLSLRVYQKWNKTNKKIFRFYVYNTPEQFIEKQHTPEVWKKTHEQDIVLATQEEQVASNSTGVISTWKENEPFLKTSAKIVFQWKIGKNKYLSGSTLACELSDSCYVNLDSSFSWSVSKKNKYAWTLDGKVFSGEKNPKWIWIESWEHEIKLLSAFNGVIVNEQSFYVSVNNTKKEEQHVDSQKEENVWEEQKDKIRFTQNIFPLKYDGLRISWIAPIWSMIEIYRDDIKILSWLTNEKWKYRIVSKNFIPWEILLDTHIILESGEKIIKNLSGEYILAWEKNDYWYVSKKSSSKKANSKTTIIPQFIIASAYADTNSQWTIEENVIVKKIFIISLLSFIFGIGFLHVMFLQVSGTQKTSILELYMLRFDTRSKVFLTL